MKIQAGVKLHNKHIIQRIDAKTGEILQVGYAENMILNRCFDRVCQFADYFSYIHYGEMAGSLIDNRTTLQTPIGYKSAIISDSKNAFPISSVTKMCELGSQDSANGKTLREIAISDATNQINTYAHIKDAERNPLGIPKTQDDIIRLYSTVVVEFINPRNTFKFINFPNNAIAKYFIDHTVPGNQITLDKADGFGNNSNTTWSVAGILTGTRTNGNNSNRSIKVKTRFLIAQGNGDIKSIGWINTGKIVLPDILFMGYQLSNISLGVGDGLNKDFNILNIDPKNLVIKINDIISIDRNIEEDYMVRYKLQDLTGVGNNGRGAAISPDGKTIVTASSSAPYITVQKLDEETGLYSKLQDLTGVGDNGYGVTISPDGKTIVTASSNAPYFTVQKLDEETGLYSKLQDLTGVGGDSRGVAISPDGKTIVTASSSAPLFTVQKLDEETGLYSKSQDLTGVGGDGYGVTISPDGKTIVTASYNAPYFTVQKLDEETGLYSKSQDLTGVGNNGRGVAISPDGKTIVTASSSAPLFTVQKLDEETGLYSKSQDLTGVGNNGRGVAISPDGKTIVTASSNSAPYFTVQKLDEETGLYSKSQDLTGVGNNSRGVAISPDGKTIVTASDSAPLFTVQKLDLYKSVNFDTSPSENSIITADYWLDYMPKSKKFETEIEFELIFSEGTP